MRSDLLLRLADLLEADAAKPDGIKFDLGKWADTEAAYPFDATIPLDCGTSGCALGLAGLSGAFKEEGLTYTPSSLTPMLRTAEGRMFWGFEAAQELFEIDQYTSYKLFSDDYYTVSKGEEAEKAVAQRIRQLVDGGTDALSDIHSR